MTFFWFKCKFNRLFAKTVEIPLTVSSLLVSRNLQGMKEGSTPMLLTGEEKEDDGHFSDQYLMIMF